MLEDPKKPDKNPVLEAVLIAFFTAVATKAVDSFFKWFDKRNKEEETEEEDTEEETPKH